MSILFEPGLRPVLKHATHDQSTHGRRGSGSVGGGLEVPAELQGAFNYAAGRSREFATGAESSVALDNLQKAAMNYAIANGYANDPDYPEFDSMTAAEIYAGAMQRRALDVYAQDKRWPDREADKWGATRVRDTFDDWRAGGDVMIKVPSGYLDEILADGVKNQFDTDTSGGLFSPDVRAVAETAAHGLPPDADGGMRPVYGFIGRPGSEHPVSVANYGDVTLVLKDSVRDRTTVTLGDSLNTTATPVPLKGPVTARQVSDATAQTMFSDEWSLVRRAGSIPLESGSIYMEAQILGGVRREDIKRIVFADRDDLDWDGVAALGRELAGEGIEVDVLTD